ncbi:MAG: patatin-like phospholipase family protein, partial [Lachnospiraceae bacterium]|nr:patatin-like phospholipase family protein [Lachnospiraceae bacterium]
VKKKTGKNVWETIPTCSKKGEAMLNTDSINKLMQLTDEESLGGLGKSIYESMDTARRISEQSKKQAKPEKNQGRCQNLTSELKAKVQGITDGWGLILSGGGGKGAYQVGVYKALQEFMPIDIKAFCGTSAGGLNAALFSVCSPEEAMEIWMDIDPVDVLTPQEINVEDLDELGDLITFEREELKSDIIKAFFEKKEAFSRKGLARVIDKSMISGKINMDTPICEITCFNTDNGMPENFLLNGLSSEEIKKGLLATSAMPIVFQPEEFMGKKYYDGGFPILGNNVPLSPLYELGLRKFLVIHLSAPQKTSENLQLARLNRKFLNETFYNGATYVHIYPHEDLGDLFDGTLNYNDSYIEATINKGYEEMKEDLFNIYLGQDNNDPFSETHVLNGKIFKSYDDMLASMVV